MQQSVSNFRILIWGQACFRRSDWREGFGPSEAFGVSKNRASRQKHLNAPCGAGTAAPFFVDLRVLQLLAFGGCKLRVAIVLPALCFPRGRFYVMY